MTSLYRCAEGASHGGGEGAASDQHDPRDVAGGGFAEQRACGSGSPLDLTERYDVEVPKGHAVFVWCVSYAAAMITHGQLGADGLMAYRRWKGNMFNQVLPPFGWDLGVSARRGL